MEYTAPIIQELQNLCALQAQQIAELSAKVSWYEEQFRLSQKQRFGRLSEQSDHEQLRIFNEAEREAKPSEPEPILEEITCRRRKRQGKRDEQLKDLPVEKKEYRLPEEEQICPSCSGDLHEMSGQTRREIKIIPAEAFVVEHVSYVYACRRCERESISTPIITASAPKPPIPGSIASASAIAHIMTGKYVDGLPLYRQEKSLSRLGIELSRQTMANWMIKAAESWLEPLYDRMHELLLKRDILHSDDYRNIYIIETDLQIA